MNRADRGFRGTSAEPNSMRIIALCGSLRKGSFNRLGLDALQALAPADFEIEIYPLGDLPLFNPDIEEERGLPPAVAAYRAAINAADGVVMSSPEYHHSISGVLKNALDWDGSPSIYEEKPIAIMSVAPGPHGGSRTQYDLRKVLHSTDAYVLAHPEVFIAAAKSKFDSSGKLTDEKIAAALTEWLAAFRAWILRMTPVSK